MNASPSIKELATALAKFQGDMKSVKKDTANPFFGSKFAELSDIIDAVRKPLADNGLSFAQFPCAENGLRTILMHSSGEWVEDAYAMRPVDAKPQSVGSAITYMRRYALCAVLGIATTDDDGNAASMPAIAKKAGESAGAKAMREAREKAEKSSLTSFADAQKETVRVMEDAFLPDFASDFTNDPDQYAAPHQAAATTIAGATRPGGPCPVHPESVLYASKFPDANGNLGVYHKLPSGRTCKGL